MTLGWKRGVINAVAPEHRASAGVAAVAALSQSVDPPQMLPAKAWHSRWLAPPSLRERRASAGVAAVVALSQSVDPPQRLPAKAWHSRWLAPPSLRSAVLQPAWQR